MTQSWFWHGGGLTAARAQFGEGDWLDLSTGINPHPWPDADDLAINWRDLPDSTQLRDLEAAAAAAFGCAPEHVCALPGTEIGLRLLATILGGQAHYTAPSYRTHAAMIPGATALAARDWAQSHGDTLILANPNNPDGRMLDRAALTDLLAQRGDAGWLVVDEAFADTHPEISMAPTISDLRRLIIFRSFGKFFGLAGVRLGFVLGPRVILDAFRERLGAWPLSAAALSIGQAAYRDTIWASAMRAHLTSEAATLDAMLAEYGLTASGHSPLFRLIETPDATALFTHLAEAHILTRPFDYNPRWLRLGLPANAAARERLSTALASF